MKSINSELITQLTKALQANYYLWKHHEELSNEKRSSEEYKQKAREASAMYRFYFSGNMEFARILGYKWELAKNSKGELNQVVLVPLK